MAAGPTRRTTGSDQRTTRGIDITKGINREGRKERKEIYFTFFTVNRF